MEFTLRFSNGFTYTGEFMDQRDAYVAGHEMADEGGIRLVSVKPADYRPVCDREDDY